MRTRTRGWSEAAALLVALGLSAPAVAQNEQFIPMPSYRQGPYAAGGTSIYGGFIDYLNLLNMRDGGLNGVKLTYEECETEYKPDRGVECYERLKGKGPTGASVFNFLSTGITYAVIGKATQDKIPLLTMAYGRTDASDGRVFPYVFPMLTNYWSLNTDIVRFIGQREGGMDKLKGKKIVHLYLGVAYGKEPNPIFLKQAEKYGFEAKLVEVPAPGTEQQAQWLEIRQYKPDWVILTGFGVMTPAAL
jgi:branched-chain amino acid transport system substrate-binding protein